MDTSETNIKMCEKAEDIQKLYAAYSGRLPIVYDSKKGKFVEIWKLPIDSIWRKTWVWLPRQDLLQEMMNVPLWQLNFKFIDWLCDTPYDGHIRHSHLDLKSMEQLWLAFVMKEKYDKTWDGDEWLVRQ